MQRSQVDLNLTSVTQPIDQESLKARLVGFESKLHATAAAPQSPTQPSTEVASLNRASEIDCVSVLSEIAAKVKIGNWPEKTVGLFDPKCAKILSEMLQLADNKDEKNRVNDGVLIKIIKDNICERVDQGQIKTEQEGASEIQFLIKTLLAIINIQVTPKNLIKIYQELDVIQILLREVHSAIPALTKELETRKLALAQNQKRFDELKIECDNKLKRIDEEYKRSSELIADLKMKADAKKAIGNKITTDLKQQLQTKKTKSVIPPSPTNKMSAAEKEKMTSDWQSAQQAQEKIQKFEALLQNVSLQRKSEAKKYDDELKKISTEIKIESEAYDQAERELKAFDQEERRLLEQSGKLTALADPVILKRTQDIAGIFYQSASFARPIEHCLDKDVKEYLDNTIERILFSKTFANIDKIRSFLLTYSNDDETIKLHAIEYHKYISDIVNGIFNHADNDTRENIFTDFFKCISYLASDTLSKKTIVDLSFVLKTIANQLLDKTDDAQDKVKNKKYPVYAMLISNAHSKADQKLHCVDLSFLKPLDVQAPDSPPGHAIATPTLINSPVVDVKETSSDKPIHLPSTPDVKESPTLTVITQDTLSAAPASPLRQSSVFSAASTTPSPTSASPRTDEKPAKNSEESVAPYKPETLKIMKLMNDCAKLQMIKETTISKNSTYDSKHSETNIIVNSYTAIAQSDNLSQSVTAFRERLKKCCENELNAASDQKTKESQLKKYQIVDTLIEHALKVLSSYEPKNGAAPNISKLIMIKFLAVQLNQLCIGGLSESPFKPENYTEELVGILKCMLSKSNSMMRKREFFKYFKETFSLKSGAYISSLEAAIRFAETADPNYKKIKPFTLTTEAELKYATLLNAVLEHDCSINKNSGRAL